MVKYNFSYDKEQDDLFLYRSDSKSRGSVEIGDFVLDYDSKEELVGLQIINASRIIKDMSDEKLSEIKKILNNLSSCKVDIKARNRTLIIRIFLSTEDKELSSVISVPSLFESSPAIA